LKTFPYRSIGITGPLGEKTNGLTSSPNFSKPHGGGHLSGIFSLLWIIKPAKD